ncbi:hypothetical protein [Mitsuaria sp. 7]|uniref:hypothetical protein n=1 Tax=Mitsuaria sp. 7 TaxID=1658665 RepID=UPI0007DD7C99|nr:hypothetical protein [Mitsuaria sp. 7]ANH66571.1 hypothetical protein ABE85_01545 [Mitsuaria sp. 7]
MNLKHFQFPEQWVFQDANDTAALFANADGDRLSINHFSAVPDITADMSDAAALRAFYRTMTELNGVAMLEVDPTRVAGLPAVRTVFKARLEPKGFAFIGSVTLPFADQSYVIKLQSLEVGTTGLREATVMAMQQGPVEVDEQTGRIIGWEQDPYDPGHQGPFMRNAADDEQYDAAFPDHPLSKVRRHLNEMIEQLAVSAEVRASEPFEYRVKKAGFWSWFKR